jgi:hypothetical protein
MSPGCYQKNSCSRTEYVGQEPAQHKGVGCKAAAAVYFLPLPCQTSRYSAAKSSKTSLAGATFRFDAFRRAGS